MGRSIPSSTAGGSNSFRKVVTAFLASEALPFAHVLSAERIERVFAKHGGLFGRQGVYSAAMVLWSFLGQVLRDGKEATCRAAAARSEDWLWKGKHAKLIDGFTFTMPDTDENQAEYPQPKSQKPGVGLPIVRVVAILSLATACVMDVALGPYSGKQTGEPALLRELFHRLDAGDVAVMDRYYCSFMMIALLLSQGTQVCV